MDIDTIEQLLIKIEVDTQEALKAMGKFGADIDKLSDRIESNRNRRQKIFDDEYKAARHALDGEKFALQQQIEKYQELMKIAPQYQATWSRAIQAVTKDLKNLTTAQNSGPFSGMKEILGGQIQAMGLTRAGIQFMAVHKAIELGQEFGHHVGQEVWGQNALKFQLERDARLEADAGRARQNVGAMHRLEVEGIVDPRERLKRLEEDAKQANEDKKQAVDQAEKSRKKVREFEAAPAEVIEGKNNSAVGKALSKMGPLGGLIGFFMSPSAGKASAQMGLWGKEEKAEAERQKRKDEAKEERAKDIDANLQRELAAERARPTNDAKRQIFELEGDLSTLRMSAGAQARARALRNNVDPGVAQQLGESIDNHSQQSMLWGQEKQLQGIGLGAGGQAALQMKHMGGDEVQQGRARENADLKLSREMTKSFKDQADALKAQREGLVNSAEEMQIYRELLKTTNAEERKALELKLQGAKEQAHRVQAQRIKNQFELPQDKYKREKKHLDELKDKGLITPREYNEALRHAAGDAPKPPSPDLHLSGQAMDAMGGDFVSVLSNMSRYRMGMSKGGRGLPGRRGNVPGLVRRGQGLVGQQMEGFFNVPSEIEEGKPVDTDQDKSPPEIEGAKMVDADQEKVPDKLDTVILLLQKLVNKPSVNLSASGIV